MIRICSNAGNARGAVHYFEGMIANGVQPDVQRFNQLFNALSFDQKDEFDVWKYYDLMTRDYELIPNIVTATSLLKVFQYKDKVEVADLIRVWNEVIVRFHLTPNDVTHRTLHAIFARKDIADLRRFRECIEENAMPRLLSLDEEEAVEEEEEEEEEEEVEERAMPGLLQ